MGSVAQRTAKQAFCGIQIAKGRQGKLNRSPLRVDSAVEIAPTSFYSYAEFIHSPGTVDRFQVTPQSLIELRSKALNPPPDPGMIDLHAPLSEQLLHVPIGKAES